MKLLFVTKHYLPRTGGVEKQVSDLSERMVRRGHAVTVLTERYENILPANEVIKGVKVIRVKFPHIKYIGLLYIWLWFIFHSKFIGKFDIVHFHSSFIWYWPLRLLLYKKPIYVTFHGWEGRYPIPFKNMLIKYIDAKLATKSIAISGYLEKYYGFKTDQISYTATDLPKKHTFKKDNKRILYVGRLDKDTGLTKILAALKLLKGFRVDFCGDGTLRAKCEQVGTVHGWVKPGKFYENSIICLSPGITSILEAFTYKCLIATTYDSPVKRDYLLTNPFSKWIIVEKSPRKLADAIKYYSEHKSEAKIKTDKCYEWVKTQNWKHEVKEYTKLWKLQ